MQERKIPTILGLVMVAGAVLLFRMAFNQIAPIFTQAKTALAPQNVVFTNISDTTFTVSWITSEPATGAIIVDGLGNNGTLFDDRDGIVTPTSAQTSQGLYLTHSVTVRNLTPETMYRVRILSGNKTFLDNGKHYELKTGPPLDGKSSLLEPAYGQVSKPDGTPAEGALVYITLEGAQTLSTLVKSTGSWVIPLHLARTQALEALLPASERINETVLVRLGNEEASATTDTINDNPVPAMTLGKTYDFRNIQADTQEPRTLAVIPETPESTQPPIPTKPAVLGADTKKQATVALLRPTKGSTLTTNLPLIQGTGVPGKPVLIVVGITKPVSGSAIVGDDGIWRYTPPKPLEPGKQSVTITTQDSTGKSVAISHGFEILKSGTQVLGDATPSATLTATPTSITLPTPTSVPLANFTPTPTVDLVGEPLPTSGNELPLLILIASGVLMLVSGGVLLRFK